METSDSSEPFISTYWTTQNCIPEDSNLNIALRTSDFFIQWRTMENGLLCDQASAGTEMNPCDNALPAQGYLTPQWLVTDEYGAVVKWWLAGPENPL